jgi:hypothetical protein
LALFDGTHLLTMNGRSDVSLVMNRQMRITGLKTKSIGGSYSRPVRGLSYTQPLSARLERRS